MNALIELELLSESRVQEVSLLANDMQISRTSGVPKECSALTVHEWAMRTAELETEELHYVITQQSEARGCCILKKINWNERHAELSFWLGVRYWRRGITTQAAFLMRDLAFEHFQMNYLHAHHLKRENTASGKILSRLGFTPDPGRADLPVSGRFQDLVPGDVWTFSILYRDSL